MCNSLALVFGLISFLYGYLVQRLALALAMASNKLSHLKSRYANLRAFEFAFIFWIIGSTNFFKKKFYQKEFDRRSERVKSVDFHPTKPW